jgi:hypothetical protein
MRSNKFFFLSSNSLISSKPEARLSCVSGSSSVDLADLVLLATLAEYGYNPYFWHSD